MENLEYLKKLDAADNGMSEETKEGWKELIKRMKYQNTFGYYNHFIYDHIAEDHCRMHLDMSPEARNPEGNVHGGCLFALADTCGGSLARADGNLWVSLNASCQYLSNVNAGRIYADAHLKRRGRKVCVADVDITAEDGKLLFAATFSFYKVSN